MSIYAGKCTPGKIFSKMKNYKNTRRPDRISPSPVRERPHETASAEDDGENGAVAGRNAVMELISANADIEKIFVRRDGKREGSIKMIVARAIAAGIPVVEADRGKLDAMCPGVNNQGIVAITGAKKYSSLDELLKIASDRGEKPFLVICDRIADPHNLGAVIRTCEGAGVHGVIIPKRKGCGVTAAVMKASAGAAEHMAVCKVSNLAETVEELKKRGLWIVACEADGTPYDKLDYNMPLAVILGSEGEGVSRLLKEKSDFVASLPMRGRVNSLNVSCAGAIMLYEILKSR